MRLFTGIPAAGLFPPSRLDLPDRHPSLRPVLPENQHLTLVFLGEVDPGRTADLRNALCRVRGTPFKLTLDRLGVFPASGRSPRILWLGPSVAPPELLDLHGQLEEALSREDFPTEARPYSPHLTLARLKSGARHAVEELLETQADLEPVSLRVRRFALFESRRGPRGMRYEILESFPFLAGR